MTDTPKQPEVMGPPDNRYPHPQFMGPPNRMEHLSTGLIKLSSTTCSLNRESPLAEQQGGFDYNELNSVAKSGKVPSSGTPDYSNLGTLASQAVGDGRKPDGPGKAQ